MAANGVTLPQLLVKGGGWSIFMSVVHAHTHTY